MASDRSITPPLHHTWISLGQGIKWNANYHRALTVPKYSLQIESMHAAVAKQTTALPSNTLCEDQGLQTTRTQWVGPQTGLVATWTVIGPEPHQRLNKNVTTDMSNWQIPKFRTRVSTIRSCIGSESSVKVMRQFFQFLVHLKKIQNMTNWIMLCSCNITMTILDCDIHFPWSSKNY